MKDEGLQRLAGGWHGQEVHPEEVFGEKILCFLEALSREIRQDPETAGKEEFVTFAFWCRRKHMEQWKKYYQNEVRTGYGMIFHIAPSNIVALFAYSMVFGLLSGNGNVIRISKKIAGEAAPLLKVIDNVMKREEYRWIYENNRIITYEHEKEWNDHYSDLCDGRVIWGGDDTIKEIQKSPMAAGIPQLAFADRYSVAIFDTAWMREKSREELQELAYRFYNDTYRVDQNACSSPKMIFWLGKKDPETENRWWDLVYQEAERDSLPAWKAERKYEELCYMAMEYQEIERITRWKNRLYLIELRSIPKPIERYDGRFGSFFTYHVTSMDEFAGCLTRKVQTILYAGVEAGAIRDSIIRRKAKGGDRIVPVGQALSMDRIWDGKDVIANLSRIISV